MSQAIALSPPNSRVFAAALAAIALLGALSVPEPVPGVDAPVPEAPSCVGCHDSEWPTTAPDVPAAPLEAAERLAIAQHLAGR